MAASEKVKQNLERLLRPRHIAFVGGSDAAFAAQQCAELFDGPVWGVNPKRSSMGNVPCYPDVESLPEAPDAVFLATPKSSAEGIVKALAEMGAGGVACFTAGYGELGKSSEDEERRLVSAAGDMALMGPNCYGLINYTIGATLWPFGTGSSHCDRGFALVMQSGMLPANITMNDRSAPISYVISAGNQSMLAIEDYVDVLIDDTAVSAIGIYAEGIRDLNQFCQVGFRALQLGKPVVILKAGSSRIAAELSVSHTGSMSGPDDAFNALFERLGMIRVSAPVQMLETLKFLSISGPLKGDKIAAFTCSGGDAAMVADLAEHEGLVLEPPGEEVSALLKEKLPPIATVSNPLDYTTPLWGNREVMPELFAAMSADNYDGAMLVQDFPPAHIHSDNSLYRNDAQSFIEACQSAGVPGAICSDLPENMDADTRQIILRGGVTPLQGLDSGLRAISDSVRYGRMRDNVLSMQDPLPEFSSTVPFAAAKSFVWNEFDSKTALRNYGVPVPAGLSCERGDLNRAVAELQFPLALKVIDPVLPHKTDAGAVRLNLQSEAEVIRAAAELEKSVKQFDPTLVPRRFLVEEMAADAIAELIVGIRTDCQFGQLLVLGSGGTLTELVHDSVTGFVDDSAIAIRSQLEKLTASRLVEGYRGQKSGNVDEVVAAIIRICNWARDHTLTMIEMEVNPLIVTELGPVAVDALIRTVPEARIA
ncbi:MAG: acetate--CoA ligase family protein [Pseudomonadota bacterium]